MLTCRPLQIFYSSAVNPTPRTQMTGAQASSPPLGAQSTAPTRQPSSPLTAYSCQLNSHLQLDTLFQFYSMATITIPSPSAFLRSPITKAVPTPTSKVSVKASTKKKSAVAKNNRKSAAHVNGRSKPKQTKSRDGTCPSSTFALSWMYRFQKR